MVQVLGAGQGNAVLVWPQREDASQRDDGYYRVLRNENRNGIWNYKSVIISSPGIYSDYPVVAMDGKGNAVIVWLEWEGYWRVMKTEYR